MENWFVWHSGAYRVLWSIGGFEGEVLGARSCGMRKPMALRVQRKKGHGRGSKSMAGIQGEGFTASKARRTGETDPLASSEKFGEHFLGS